MSLLGLSESDLKIKKRALKLINLYDPNYTESQFDELIKGGSIDYFYSIFNRGADGRIEESDAELMTEIIEELRKKL